MDNVWLTIGAAAGLAVGMILHEYAHALAAVAAGDKTPKLHGRLTLKPKAHADPVGTIILPIVFLIPILVGKPLGMIFGYAKPVTYNSRAMRDPKRSALFVALSGPATNFALAVLGGAALLVTEPGGASVFRIVSQSSLRLALASWVTVNAFLALINVLPIPPLDGSKVLAVFLSPSAAFKMEELGQYMLVFIVILFLIFKGVLSGLAEPICRAASLGSMPGCIL